MKFEQPIFKVVGNGGLSLPNVGEGRIYPCLILDTGDDMEIKELFKIHKETPPGDTILIWAQPNTLFKAKTVVLTIKFTKPMEVSFGVEFNIKDQYSLTDGVIQQRGVILMSGKRGNKVADLIKDSILVEVPNLDFDKFWNSILRDTLKEKLKKMGVVKKDLNNKIDEHIKSMREFWNVRRPS